MLRKDVIVKLTKALDTELFTTPQKEKFYHNNFDEFISKPCITNLDNNGFSFMGENLTLVNDQNQLVLPSPVKTPVGPKINSYSDEVMTENEASETEEWETVKGFFFPFARH